MTASVLTPGPRFGTSGEASSTRSVVVVGGGLAGLAAATYLARGGARVTLLERSPSMGGRAATDVEHGFALNRGAHALYTGGPASAVLGELGVRYSSGIPKRIMARDASGVHPFPSTAPSLFGTGLLDAGDKLELTQLLIRVSRRDLSRLGGVSVAAWIEAHAKRQKVRDLLRAMAVVYTYCTALDLVSADVFVSRFQQTMRAPVHYVDGGWQALVDALVDVAMAAGAVVRTSARVTSIGDGRRVQLVDGTQLECSDVVLAVPPEDAARLTGTEFPDVVGAHIACLDLALERLPNPACPVLFDLEQPRFMTVQSEFAHLTATGAVIHVLEQLDPRAPAEPSRDRADMEALLDEVQPGWRELVVTSRFLPRMLAVGALPLASNGGLAGRPGYNSAEVPNVYFAGDWVGSHGFLVDASLDSARAVARRILSMTAAVV